MIFGRVQSARLQPPGRVLVGCADRSPGDRDPSPAFRPPSLPSTASPPPPAGERDHGSVPERDGQRTGDQAPRKTARGVRCSLEREARLLDWTRRVFDVIQHLDVATSLDIARKEVGVAVTRAELGEAYITVHHERFEGKPTKTPRPPRVASRFEVEQALAQHPTRTRAAASLGISTRTLYKRIKEYGL